MNFEVREPVPNRDPAINGIMTVPAGQALGHLEAELPIPIERFEGICINGQWFVPAPSPLKEALGDEWRLLGRKA